MNIMWETSPDVDMGIKPYTTCEYRRKQVLHFVQNDRRIE